MFSIDTVLSNIKVLWNQTQMTVSKQMGLDYISIDRKKNSEKFMILQMREKYVK